MEEIKETEKSALFLMFSECSISELEKLLSGSASREESVFYRTLLNLKLQLAQERVVGEKLL